MLERLGRLCVGLGLLWVLVVMGTGLMFGLDTPEQLAPFADVMIGSDLRRLLYFGLTFVVVPVGMLMIVRDMIGDPEPLWLKLAAPGGFAAIYALFLAAAAPQLGQPALLAVDPMLQQVLPNVALTRDPADGASWFLRFGGLLAIIAGIPGALGFVAGFFAGGARSR